MTTLYLNISNYLNESGSLALCTLVKKKGSTPQIVGASALISQSGVIAGTIGGGVVELETTHLAQQAIGKNQNSLATFQLNNDLKDFQGAICGGEVKVIIDAHPARHKETFGSMARSLSRQRNGLLVTEVQPSKGGVPQIRRYWLESEDKWPDTLHKKLTSEGMSLEQLFQIKQPLLLGNDDSFLFFEPHFPLPELIIVGAGHIGQALAHQGILLDFQVTVMDNRPDQITKEKFPGIHRSFSGSFEDAFQQVNITDNSYVVIATQGHVDDMVALKCCIHQDPAYLGLIGSRRKIKQVHDHFIHEGICSKEQFDRIHAPIGMDIHSKTVQEIAISIAAQLVKVRHENKAFISIPKVGGVILAAGKSKRMKQQKLLMDYKGDPIMKHIIQQALGAKLHQVVVVTGSHRKQIEKVIDHLPVKSVYNTNFEQGMLSSVICGVQAMNGEIDAMLVMLGDQPYLSSGLIDSLINVYQSSQKGIVVPTYKGKRGHPLLIDAKYREDILGLNPEVGLRQLMQIHQNDILELETPTESILIDIDTPEDYYLATGKYP
jgi:xanthine dehydrogenase accessory factor